ncbi:MAG: hypothetical protein PVG89_17070 [Gammaproteobacteria bacterium]|jgi:hypothetical protein
MNKTLIKLVVGVFSVFVANSAFAELLVNPVSKTSMSGMELSGHFGSSSVEYERNGVSGDIDRTFLGVTAAYGASRSFDIYGTFSYTIEAEAEGIPGDDTGYILGGGVRGSIPNDMGFTLHGYAQLLLIDEEYGFSVDGEETSIMAGVVASAPLNKDIKIYGGMELNLISDMEINSADADRDDFLGFRFGANFDTGSFLVNVNTALIHENGIFISMSQPF